MNKEPLSQLWLGKREQSLTDELNIAKAAKRAGFTKAEIEELKRLYPAETKKEQQT